uniref:NADH-ubiquinone oxidoreductase chain 2 n=1 Tax=Scaptocoris castanea TaxID=1411909 RepID=A0A343YVQ4_9HEMI|nr:NADH dehydrogenase subunit 2 [Scaptocoris castanea]
MFMITMMMGTLLTLSSQNWMSMWMGLEINMLSFLPIMMNKPSTKASEAMMMYFLIQSIGSTMLLFSVSMNMMFYSQPLKMNLIMTLSMLIKLGGAPFHLWVPEMMSKMKWSECMLLMTWQSLAPLHVMSNIKINNNTLMIMVMMSTIIGAVGGLNQTSLRKLMGYSSINHLGWMMATISNHNSWTKYFTLYSITACLTCFMMNHYKALFINQMNIMTMNLSETWNYLMIWLSLGGLPPLLGFLPKWLVIQTMMSKQAYIMMIIMIMMSLITLFYYMRTMTSMMIKPASSNQWMYTKSTSWKTTTCMIINLSFPVLMIMNFV